MSFRFRLQRVLELREEAEQARARALASAQDAAEAARRAEEALAALRASSRAEIEAAQAELPRVGHLHGLGMVLESLEARLAGAAEMRTTAEHQVQQAQEELADAARERRILDRLKEKHAEEWRAAEAQKDRVQMDEIALARFARQRDTTDTTQNDR
jgi:flagellar FliJ protein